MSRIKGRLLKAILGVIVVVVLALLGTRAYLGTSAGVSAVGDRYRGRPAESLGLLCAVLRPTGRTLPLRLQWWMGSNLRVSAPGDQDRIIEVLVPPFREFRAFDVNTSSPIMETLKLSEAEYEYIDTISLSTRYAIIDALLERADPKLAWRCYKDLVMVNALSCPLDDRFRFDTIAEYGSWRASRDDESLRKWWETEGAAKAIQSYREWWKMTKDPLTSGGLVLLDNS